MSDNRTPYNSWKETSMIRNILTYLEKSAERFPDKIAFADDKNECTYQELRNRAKAVGTCLQDKITHSRPVPVLMEKGVSAVTAFMGVVYAGCFYILLDPKLPTERLRQIIDTLEAGLIVTDMEQASYRKQLEKLEFSGEVVDLGEAVQTAISEEVLQSIRAQSVDTDPLYANFTSGSTGVPKGVVVSHRSVIDFIEEFTRLFDITSEDVIGNQAPFDFDVSVKDIYSALKVGATMQIIPKQYFSFPVKLLDFLVEREVTTLIWAVSALCIITTLKGFEYKIPKKVSKVIFSGEVMPVKHLNLWREAIPDAMYVNVYGPTEITCNCTYYVIDREFAPGEVLPIGRAFPNEKVFLLDENDRLVTAEGVKGELCVAGTALSLGYYNNPEQTAKAFVQNPLNSNYLERIYRTGDLAYYGADGNLYFASRKDFQIKHMGHRIELGEIELGLEKIGEIVRSCCMYEEEAHKIIAFYEGAIEKKQIVRVLGQKLPAFMIPNVFVQLEKLPVTKNGKIDRKLLMQQYMEGLDE